MVRKKRWGMKEEVKGKICGKSGDLKHFSTPAIFPVSPQNSYCPQNSGYAKQCRTMNALIFSYYDRAL
jgi:hypothetical protein